MQQSAQPLPVKNYLLNIWTQPRDVIRDILDTRPGLYVIPITLFAGFLQGLTDGFVSALIGLLLAVPGLYLSAFLIRWVGSWFAGSGSSEDIRTALVWGGCVPGLQLSAVIFVFALLSNTVLSGALLSLGQGGVTAFLSVYVILGCWLWIVSLKAIAEAHDFSSYLALLTQVAIVVILVVPIFLISALF